ncbi:unnamed protein product [Prorocentrum cordatum]|uniref:Uncharacterized protein n=1 Tax=Prorocentrum cordatum TaxID=2364126 RepID=A0ABN9XBR8_9DINO|nr:unnamed protein product [Polarella glacialis]
MDQNSEHALEYKNRKMSSQPLHAAALFQAKSSQEGPRRAEELVRMLLEARADVTAQAESELAGQSRRVQALHMAAGAGNVGVIRLLLEHRADPDAAAALEIRKESDEAHTLPPPPRRRLAQQGRGAQVPPRAQGQAHRHQQRQGQRAAHGRAAGPREHRRLPRGQGGRTSRRVQRDAPRASSADARADAAEEQ